jgi:hypothetical protein
MSRVYGLWTLVWGDGPWSILDWAAARLADVGRAVDSGYESSTRCNEDEEGGCGDSHLGRLRAAGRWD